MPGLVPARRSIAAVDEEDEDVHYGQTPNSRASSESSSTNKRPRVHIDGDEFESQSNGDASDSHIPRSRSAINHLSSESHSDDEPTFATTDSWSLQPPATVRQQQRTARGGNVVSDLALARQTRADTREHKPGSIVRVTLENFVTYTSATFNPGPALNMVIGPNGTGKSTLVCAICLGLGWGPKHLGRAKEPGEFVKHGNDEASIEIELKGMPGRRNSVIKRSIKREGNKSAYSVNGESSNATNVLALAKSYGIQVDNLCHFLPQDRVVEFAGLTPVDRLTQTLRAAAPEYMVEQHDELKKYRAEQRTAEHLQANVKQHLTNLEGRQNAQRADVERIRERDEISQKVMMLEKLRPFAEYVASQVRVDLTKAQKRSISAELSHLRAENEPNMNAVNAKMAYKENVDKVVKQRKTLYDSVSKQADRIYKHKQELDEKVKDCKVRRVANQEMEKKRKVTLAKIQNTIRDLEARLKEPPIAFDPAAYNEQTRDKDRQRRELGDRIGELRVKTAEWNGIIEDKNNRISRANENLKNLRSQAGQQLSKLEKLSSDTKKAWDWVQKHADRFQNTVYGPPLVVCSVRDKNYIAQMEAIVSRGEMLAITCTSREDFKILQDAFYSELGLIDVYPRNINDLELSRFQPPVTKEEMEQLGLGGWALDQLSGPEPVLAMLCSEVGLHATGTMRHCNDAQFEALENSSVSRWFDQKSTFRVTRRREYAGHSSTRSLGIKAAQWWTDQGVDTRAEDDARDNIAGWTAEIEEAMREKDRDNAQIKELTDRQMRLLEEKNSLNAEKDEKQRAETERRGLPIKLEAAQRKLEEHHRKDAELYEEYQKLHGEESEVLVKKGQCSIDYSRTIEQVRGLYVQLLTSCVAQIEATSDLEQLEQRHEAALAQLRAKEQEKEEVEQRLQTLRAEARRAQQIMKVHCDRDPQLSNAYDSLPEAEKYRVPEDLDEEIESQKARLELLQGGDPRTVREYEQRAKEIERLQREQSDNEDTLTSLEQSISSIRAKWEPELEGLVRQISNSFAASFEKINCAGGVEVYKGGANEKDFENWAIHINVKFREHEELSLLDNHRQSGGERAVSTIFYLMALQSLSRAPFRVVDEINQGMDPRNERMVHEMMVDIACGTAEGEEADGGQGSQYFLITPKLLTDLKYKPGMKVHCIASGERMPADHRQLDFPKLVQRAKSLFGSESRTVNPVGA